MQDLTTDLSDPTIIDPTIIVPSMISRSFQ